MLKWVTSLCLSALLASTAFSGCDNGFEPLPPEIDRFTMLDKPGYVAGGKYIFEYNEDDSQRLVNEKHNVVMYQKDNQLSFVRMIFSALPFNAAQINTKLIEVEVFCRREGAEDFSKRLQMVIMKEIEGKFWMWNVEESTGIIVDFS